MDQLIKVVNRLQDVFETVSVSNPIDLPQIVVIGSQSSGKSSVLENIVGRDFLPRGTGIVTRRPLVLQLINRPIPGTTKSMAMSPTSTNSSINDSMDCQEMIASLPPGSDGNTTNDNEWGEFLHKPGQKLHDFDAIREEIIAETDRKTGSSKNISIEPIHLRVYSPYVLTLTLVDLPGLTKVPVGDQPKDIERLLREMSLKFITKPNAIILAVTAANTDLANSDGLKLAREVDPDGLRTIGVLTKTDLMDKGTDVVDILAGRVIPLRLGYAPVVNRGQKDIEHKKSIRQALETERCFFEEHPSYASRAQYCGTPFLTRRLHVLLLNHIRATLPDIKAKIATVLLKTQNELSSLGEGPLAGSPSSMILQIITEFCADFRAILDGQTADLATSELNGGARIAFVFHEIFANAIASMDPFDSIKEVDIRTLLYNSSGSTPALFVATAAFEVLVKQQIKRLEDPSIKCGQMTFDELGRILGQLLQKPVFRRFPILKEKFYATVISFFRKGMDPTNKMLHQLVAAETSYINIAHPDFINGHKAMAIVYEKLHGASARQSPQSTSATVPIISNNERSIGSNDLKLGSRQQQQQQTLTPLPTQQQVQVTANQMEDNNGGIFGSFFKKQGKSKPGILEAPPTVLKASGSVSEREFTEIEVIKLLIQSYFSIVKRTIIDMVPKCIMLNLVVWSREEMQRGLLSELYKEDLIAELLAESPDTVSRRSECKKMISALEKADEIVSTI